MKEEFKVLTIKEEQQLTSDELKEYYKNLREYLLKRKLTNTTPGATTIAPKLKGITNKIAAKLIKLFTTNDIEIICEGTENIPEGPVIFAQTHQGILDNFVWIPQIDKHSIILHHQDVSKFLIVAQYNTGLVLIKKDDEINSANAKLDLMELLLKGHSIHWSPEGTYCLSPNKFHLPLRYGVIDVAKKTGSPIIPVAHEYTYTKVNDKIVITKIRSKYGKPIYVKETDDLLEKLEEYKESISTLKYELIEANGTFERKNINNFDYINYIKEIYKDIETGNVDKDKERENIFTANADFYKFHHINDIPFNEFGEFLETEEVRKLKEIDKQQEIKRIKLLIENMNQKQELKKCKILQKHSQKL